MGQVLSYQTGTKPKAIQRLHAFILLRPLFKNKNTRLQLNGSLFVTSTDTVSQVLQVESVLTKDWNRFIGSETFYTGAIFFFFFVNGAALCTRETAMTKVLQGIYCLSYNQNMTADHRLGYLTYSNRSPFVSHYPPPGLPCVHFPFLPCSAPYNARKTTSGWRVWNSCSVGSAPVRPITLALQQQEDIKLVCL